MTTATWIDGTADWTTAVDWSTGSVPGAGDDAVIPFGTVSLTTSITVNSILLSTAAASLGIEAGGIAESVVGSFTNTGTVNINTNSSGTTLTIGGTLINTGSFTLGFAGLTASSTVNAGGFTGNGSLNLTGNGGAQATLNINGQAPGTWTAAARLIGPALLEFATGGITAIGSGASLLLSGSQARVGLAGSAGTNSALAGLASNAGSLTLSSGAALATNNGVDLVNSGAFTVAVGSSATLGGVLTNTGGLGIGDLSQYTSSVTAAGLNNTGQISISGNQGLGSLIVGSAAPSTITGTITLTGDASLQFTGGGSIDSIASGAVVDIETWKGQQPAFAALSGLTSNAGNLKIDAQNINGGIRGGLNLTFTGTVNNPGRIDFGEAVLNSGNDTVTMGGLVNTGILALTGGQVSSVTLNIQAAAPSTLTGLNSVGDKAVLQYASGAITGIAAGSALSLFGTGRVAVSGKGGSSALTQLASNAGVFDLSANVATDAGVDFTNSGTVNVGQGVLALGGQLNNGASFTIGSFSAVTASGLGNSGQLTLSVGSSINIFGDASNSGTWSVDGNFGGSAMVGGTLANSGTLNFGSITLSASTSISASALVNTATMNLTGVTTASLRFTVNGAASNSGTVTIGHFSTLSLSGGNAYTQTLGSTTINAGALTASQVNIGGGMLLFSSALTSSAGTGPIALSSNGSVEFGAAADSSVSVNFAGPGTVKLDAVGQFAGTLGNLAVTASGNAPSDEIDLTAIADSSIAAASLNTASDVLTVTASGGTFNIQLSGSYAPGTLVGHVADSTGNGSDVFLNAPVCFCRGTLILTGSGEVPIEELAVGEQVVTLSGRTKPIVWIGVGRSLATRANKLARPIIVRRGALAEGVPKRDLYLTHGHALYLDGVLIPVENLINHRSILWDDRAQVVEYYHIELEDHDVVLANGAPAESYYDANNRAQFHNTRPGSAPGAAKPAFAPVLTGGGAVDRVWTALFARSGGRLDIDTTDDPDLHLVVDSARLEPSAIDGFAYDFALAEPPAAGLQLRSRSGVPSLLGITRHDHRRLGVAISRIELRQRGLLGTFAPDAPLFVEGGCHPAEGGYCWTDGQLDLPACLFLHLTGPFTLAVQIERPGMRYPIAAVRAAAA